MLPFLYLLMRFILVLFFLLHANLNAQTIQLFVKSYDGIGVPYVYIRDSVNNQLYGTDSTGHCMVKTKDAILYFTHVSYQTKRIVLTHVLVDTSITIFLENRNEVIEPITVQASKNKKLIGIYSYGNFKKSSGNGGLVLNFGQRLHYGFWVKLLDSGQKYLHSIDFALKRKIGLREMDFVIELKVYGINDGCLSVLPLHRKPIYIQASTLGKKNRIAIEERIPIGTEGVFISFELPLVYDKKGVAVVLPLAGRWEQNEADEKCWMFVGNDRSVPWNGQRIKPMPIEMNGSFASGNVGIRYSVYE